MKINYAALKSKALIRAVVAAALIACGAGAPYVGVAPVVSDVLCALIGCGI